MDESDVAVVDGACTSSVHFAALAAADSKLLAAVCKALTTGTAEGRWTEFVRLLDSLLTLGRSDRLPEVLHAWFGSEAVADVVAALPSLTWRPLHDCSAVLLAECLLTRGQYEDVEAILDAHLPLAVALRTDAGLLACGGVNATNALVHEVIATETGDVRYLRRHLAIRYASHRRTGRQHWSALQHSALDAVVRKGHEQVPQRRQEFRLVFDESVVSGLAVH